VRGKEGISLGTYSVRALQASYMRVACASQLYNYILRFYLIIPPFKKGRPNPLYT